MTTSERVQALFAERDREIERLMKEWETERDAAQGEREALKMAQQQAAAQVERLSKQTDAALNMAEIWKDKAVKLAAGQPECERCGGFAILCAKCAAAQREEIIEECVQRLLDLAKAHREHCDCDCHKDWTRTTPCANCLDCKFLTVQATVSAAPDMCEHVRRGDCPYCAATKPTVPSDTEAWLEIESIEFASVEDRKKCEKLLREWNSRPTAPCPLVEKIMKRIDAIGREPFLPREEWQRECEAILKAELEAWEASNK